MASLVLSQFSSQLYPLCAGKVVFLAPVVEVHRPGALRDYPGNTRESDTVNDRLPSVVKISII